MYFLRLHSLYFTTESGASNVMSEKWRSPTEYTAALYVSVLQSENEQQKSGYEILLSKPLDSVIKVNHIRAILSYTLYISAMTYS